MNVKASGLCRRLPICGGLLIAAAGSILPPIPVMAAMNNAASPEDADTVAEQNNQNQAAPQAPQAPSVTGQTGQTGDGGSKKTSELGEVTVTGQLAAIQHAQEVKKDAVNMVDSVSAEEAGKFPDPNVADALQRVPGVSVDRSGGESSNIAIRGFGPNFVAVTLNGRTMPTSSNPTDADTSRAFNFDVLPSEIISLAQVNKTSSADITETDIGGVVDIQTARPLDFHGFHATGSLAGAENTLYPGFQGKVTPKASAVLGWTNSDSTFGWLTSFTYYKRDDVQLSTQSGGWFVNQNISQDSGLSNPNYTNVAIPQTLANNWTTESRVRQGFSGAIDWRPVDKLTIKLDTLYSNYKVNSTTNEFGEFGNTADIQSLTVDNNNTVTNYVRNNTGVMANDYVEYNSPKNEKLSQVGLNMAWQFDESTKITVDIADSKAWNKLYDNGYFLVMGTRNVGVNPTWNGNGAYGC
jgi:iron complex outermembrane receptor protein